MEQSEDIYQFDAPMWYDFSGETYIDENSDSWFDDKLKDAQKHLICADRIYGINGTTSPMRVPVLKRKPRPSRAIRVYQVVMETDEQEIQPELHCPRTPVVAPLSEKKPMQLKKNSVIPVQTTNQTVSTQETSVLPKRRITTTAMTTTSSTFTGTTTASTVKPRRPLYSLNTTSGPKTHEYPQPGHSDQHTGFVSTQQEQQHHPKPIHSHPVVLSNNNRTISKHKNPETTVKPQPKVALVQKEKEKTTAHINNPEDRRKRKLTNPVTPEFVRRERRKKQMKLQQMNQSPTANGPGKGSQQAKEKPQRAGTSVR